MLFRADLALKTHGIGGRAVFRTTQPNIATLSTFHSINDLAEKEYKAKYHPPSEKMQQDMMRKRIMLVVFIILLLVGLFSSIIRNHNARTLTTTHQSSPTNLEIKPRQFSDDVHGDLHLDAILDDHKDHISSATRDIVADIMKDIDINLNNPTKRTTDSKITVTSSQTAPTSTPPAPSTLAQQGKRAESIPEARNTASSASSGEPLLIPHPDNLSLNHPLR